MRESCLQSRSEDGGFGGLTPPQRGPDARRVPWGRAPQSLINDTKKTGILTVNGLKIALIARFGGFDRFGGIIGGVMGGV